VTYSQKKMPLKRRGGGYPTGYVIVAEEHTGHELIRVIKGQVQVCLERGISFTRDRNGKASACLQQKIINQHK